MRISDWSSDVCSSDLSAGRRRVDKDHIKQEREQELHVGTTSSGHSVTLPPAKGSRRALLNTDLPSDRLGAWTHKIGDSLSKHERDEARAYGLWEGHCCGPRPPPGFRSA